jgi:hypothetical protein|tara:strand:+ start:43 stop:285 length:243 start_codon:yes stop_codon:yes gene_type:complete
MAKDSKDNKPEWQVKHEAMLVDNRETLALLSKTQNKAIETTVKTLTSVVEMLNETHDMYLSDIRELENARWQLYSAFRTD